MALGEATLQSSTLPDPEPARPRRDLSPIDVRPTTDYESGMPSERFGPKQRARLEEMLRLRPPAQTLTWSDVARIDDERLWWTLRGLDRDALMVLLARAVGEVPVHRLAAVFRDYVRPGDIGATRDQLRLEALALVTKFCNLAERGHFYEEAAYRGSQQSRGTQLFVAQFAALIDRCVNDSAAAPTEVVPAFEMLFDLMRHIDSEPSGIVYFTDESGSWQLHVQWPEVVPAYLDSLAQTVPKEEFNHRVDRLLRDFGGDVAIVRTEPRALAAEAWARHSK